MSELAVTAMGPDRPGIVAAVADALRDHGGNVEDSAMTILGGRFSLVLLVDTEETAEQLESSLQQATDELGLVISVADAGGTTEPPTPTHILSVYGEDRPGIVADITLALAGVGASITDLSTRVIGEDDEVYAMVVEFVTEDEATLREDLAEVASTLNVDWTLRAIDDTTY